ncbi:hypothetical protein [Actinoplanes solisilvae]|uniref:hypothetical protein n=1 Tax=Actinoplanes solisilvae TaxID=2486853 RepID=UPI000FD94D92|nr:hypothetical protein [Actinoplanes solisilvae]
MEFVAGIAVAVAVAAVAAVVAAVVRRRRRRAAERAAEAGAAPTVFAAVRRLDANLWRGRWRHGYATVRKGEVQWRPRWPRPGPAVELKDVAVEGRPRRAEWYENWWLAPGVRIYRLTAAEHYELAVVDESRDLFENVLAGRETISRYRRFR